jgi:hypothetical protein
MENAPQLEIDKILYKGGQPPARTIRERRIVWNLFLHLAKNGWKVSTVYDGEDNVDTNSMQAAMEIIFNLDDARVYFTNGVEEHSVVLVLGNDMDIISDWNYANNDPDGFNAAMDKFDAEAFA